MIYGGLLVMLLAGGPPPPAPPTPGGPHPADDLATLQRVVVTLRQERDAALEALALSQAETARGRVVLAATDHDLKACELALDRRTQDVEVMDSLLTRVNEVAVQERKAARRAAFWDSLGCTAGADLLDLDEGGWEVAALSCGIRIWPLPGR